MQYLLLWNVMLIIFLSGCGPSPQSIIEAYNNGQKDIVWDYIDNGDGSGSDNGGNYTEDTSDQDIEYYE